MVCIVHSAGEPRLDEPTTLTLKRLKSIFTESCLKNFVCCLTNSPKFIAPNCLDSLKVMGFSDNTIFRFENSCLAHPDTFQKHFEEKGLETPEEVADTISQVSIFWRENKKEIEQLIKKANELELIQIDQVNLFYSKKEAFDNHIKLVAEKIRIVDDRIGEAFAHKQIVEKHIKEFQKDNPPANAKLLLEFKKIKLFSSKKVKKYLKYSEAVQQIARKQSAFSKVVTGIRDMFSKAPDYSAEDKKGRCLEEYYEWVDQIEEVEALQLGVAHGIMVEKENSEEIKWQNCKRVTDRELAPAEDLLQKFTSELKTAKEERDTLGLLLKYLVEEFEQFNNGADFAIDREIAECEKSLEQLEKKFKVGNKVYYNNPELNKQKQDLTREKEKLGKLKNILEYTRGHKSEATPKFYEELRELKMLLISEQSNEDKKLNFLRDLYSQLEPCLINTSLPKVALGSAENANEFSNLG